MGKLFPRTNVGGVSLSRMIIGTNWILGYSHTSLAADNMIRCKNHSPQVIADMLEVFLNSGVDTIMGPFVGNPHLVDAVKLAEDRTGKGMIIIDTPIINVDDNAEARREAEQVFKNAAAVGCTFSLMHHTSVEQLVNKNKRIIDRLPDYL